MILHKSAIIFRKFNKIKNSDCSNDEKILNFLKIFGRPTTPATIGAATGLSNAKVSQRLKQLCRYKILKVVYKRYTPFYWFVEKRRK